MKIHLSKSSKATWTAISGGFQASTPVDVSYYEFGQTDNNSNGGSVSTADIKVQTCGDAPQPKGDVALSLSNGYLQVKGSAIGDAAISKKNQQVLKFDGICMASVTVNNGSTPDTCDLDALPGCVLDIGTDGWVHP
ncbi:MAG TPA: hypothetical protein VG168_12850 [Bryobacteraceae bacterium]|jgi:hypothetical protein|nr:hypothetical protein [Bryobacteraceae bacterium]